MTDLAALLEPRDPELQRIASRVFEARPDLQKAFGRPDSLGYRAWLAVDGVLEYPEVAARHAPLPPEELRATVCGGIERRGHLYTGFEDFRAVAEIYECYAQRGVDRIDAVLDFGCGCGRVLRWFRQAVPDCRRVGADVRAAAIAWCRQHLDGAFLANTPEPPLDLPTNSVDLSYALSVFSHLALDQSDAWMRELVRVTRPGGLILASTHGAFALMLTRRSEAHQRGLGIGADEVPDLLARLGTDGFVHRRLSDEGIDRGDGVAADYGQTFLTERFAHERWNAYAEVLGCVPVALGLFQDVHVLRVRG